MEDRKIKVAIDIGSSKVTVLMGEALSGKNQIKLIAEMTGNCEGVRKGVIEDPESVSICLRRVLDEVEFSSGIKVKKAIFGISGKDINSFIREVRYPIEGGEVSEDHFESLIRLAEENVVDENDYILHRMSYNYRVDNSGIVRNPIGIRGNTLEADVHLVLAEKDQVEILKKVAKKCGIEAEGIFLNSYSSSLSVLSSSETKSGTVLVDVGDGTTDIAIFKNHKLIYTAVLPLGGKHYINDISYVLNIDPEMADYAKREVNRKASDENIVIYANNNEEENKVYKVSFIKDIMDARSKDIVEYLNEVIDASGFRDYINSGIVITGGAAKVTGLPEMLRESTGMSVEVRKPLQIPGISEAFFKPEMSTAIGILLASFEKVHQDKIIQVEQNRDSLNVEEKLEEPKVKLEKTVKKRNGLKDWIANFF